MSEPIRNVVYLTAGAGGMFCGSCLNDNTLARALTEQQIDVQLVPTYTPIRTDEEDVSVDQVFFGGINVYLQQKFAPFRFLPRVFDGLLNNPRLLRWLTNKDLQADPDLMGPMTVSMLRGQLGFQRKEQARLLNFLSQAKPDLVNFTNVLIAGSSPEIKRRLGIPIVVTLQGDDIFLDFLPERYREAAIAQIHQLAVAIDAFIVHSEYYANTMSERLQLPRDKFHIVPLGIDSRDFVDVPEAQPPASEPGPNRIGYLARLSPEKGLHVLVEAFQQIRATRTDVELHLAGWLGNEHRGYAEEQFSKLSSAGLEQAFQYHGVIDRHQKHQFLRQLDVFTVPTTYQEPKGRFALEAMACGIPVVLPNHGAFPELMEQTQAGLLVPPQDPAALATAILELLADPAHRAVLGSRGLAAIQGPRSAEAMGRRTLEVYRHAAEIARQRSV